MVNGKERVSIAETDLRGVVGHGAECFRAICPPTNCIHVSIAKVSPNAKSAGRREGRQKPGRET